MTDEDMDRQIELLRRVAVAMRARTVTFLEECAVKALIVDAAPELNVQEVCDVARACKRYLRDMAAIDATVPALEGE